jgi:hypothetical protein
MKGGASHVFWPWDFDATVHRANTVWEQSSPSGVFENRRLGESTVETVVEKDVPWNRSNEGLAYEEF